MKLEIFKWNGKIIDKKLNENQRIHVSRNRIIIYHYNSRLSKHIDDEEIKYDIFKDSFIIS